MLPSEVAALAYAYVPGEGAIEGERHGIGLVNETYRVTRAGRCYALRVAVADAIDLCLDRGWECRVLERAAAAGIGPAIERCDPKRGILVARWTEGRPMVREQIASPPSLDAIASLLRRIQSMAVPEQPRVMSPGEWAAHYLRALAERGGCAPADLCRMLEAKLAELGQLAAAAGVLCHSDLHVENLIESAHGLVALDWEYAHLSEPFWDLAGWVGNNDLPPDARQRLFESYLGRAPVPAEERRLRLICWLYDAVCLLWILVFQTPDLRPRAELLLARLRG